MLDRSQKAGAAGKDGVEAMDIMGSGPPGSVLLNKTGGDKGPMSLRGASQCLGLQRKQGAGAKPLFFSNFSSEATSRVFSLY